MESPLIFNLDGLERGITHRGQTMADPTNTSSDRSTACTSNIGRRSFLRATGTSAALGLFAGCSGDEADSGGGAGIAETVTIGHLAPLNNPLGVGSTAVSGDGGGRNQ